MFGSTNKKSVHIEAPVIEEGKCVFKDITPKVLISTPDWKERRADWAGRGNDTRVGTFHLRPSVSGANWTFEDGTTATVWGRYERDTVRMQFAVHGDADQANKEFGADDEEETLLFRLNSKNMIDLSVMYDWWSLYRRSGMRINYYYEELKDRYRAFQHKFMNRRLWYSACWTFMARLKSMADPAPDPISDACNRGCTPGQEEIVVMDGTAVNLSTDMLTESAKALDTFDFILPPDGAEEVTHQHDALSHNVKLSINFRSLQQHLDNPDGSGELPHDTAKPFSDRQRPVMQQLGLWFAGARCAKKPSDRRMEDLCAPSPPSLHSSFCKGGEWGEYHCDNIRGRERERGRGEYHCDSSRGV